MEINTSNLLKGLEIVSKINKKATTKTMNFDNVTMRADNNTLTLNSVFVDTQIVFTLHVSDGKNIEAGIDQVEKLCKELKKFNPICNLNLSDDNCSISDGKKNIKLFNALENNTIDKIAVNPFKIDGVTLESAYKKVKCSIAKDETRKILTGVHFKNNFIETCDGYRISQVDITDNYFCQDFTVDPFVLDLFLSLAKKDKLELTIDADDRKCMISASCRDYSFYIISNLIRGEFFNSDSLFKEDYNYCLTFNDNEELLNETNFIKDMLDTKDYKKNPIKMFITGDKLEIKTTDENTSTSVDAQIYLYNHTKQDNLLRIGFNPIYLLDAIKNVTGEFTMQLLRDISPCIIKNEHERYCVLPVRLQD